MPAPDRRATSLRPAAAPDPEAAWRADVLAELRAIRALLERGAPAAEAENADEVNLCREIATTTCGKAFFASDLIDAAGLRGGEGLRKSIVDRLGELNTQRLGKLLQDLAGKPRGGVVIKRDREERGVAVWVSRRQGEGVVGVTPTTPVF